MTSPTTDGEAAVLAGEQRLLIDGEQVGASGGAGDPQTIGANVGATFSLTSPLGGVRQSGPGRRYGEQGFEEYLEVKAIGLPER